MRIGIFLCLFALGSAAFLSWRLVRGNALRTSFYMDALDKTAAFDRVYDELLADVELAGVVDPFFKFVPLDRPLAVSILRFVAPPEQLRTWSASAIDRAVGYVRGDSERFQVTLTSQSLSKIREQRSLLM